MTRRRNSPLLNGGSHSALPDGSNGAPGQGSSGGSRLGRPIKLTFGLLLLSAMYYHIAMREKSSILLETQKPTETKTKEVVKDEEKDLLALRSKPHKLELRSYSQGTQAVDSWASCSTSSFPFC